MRRALTYLAAAAVVGALSAAPLLAGAPDDRSARVAVQSPERLREVAAMPSVGDVVDEGWARGCLTAAGAADPGAALLDSRPYPEAERPAVLLVLGTGIPGRLRLVVVPADCGPGTARVLAEAVTG